MELDQLRTRSRNEDVLALEADEVAQLERKLRLTSGSRRHAPNRHTYQPSLERSAAIGATFQDNGLGAQLWGDAQLREQLIE